MLKIKRVSSHIILDSRGKKTLQTEVETDNGVFSASVPSGASLSSYEVALLDAETAVKNVEQEIAPEIIGREIKDQEDIDSFLISLDGTENKKRLGGNAILSLSMSVCRALAASENLPLFKYIGKISKIDSSLKIPFPMFNFIEGGAHADNDLDIQEFLVSPRFSSFRENYDAGINAFNTLKQVLGEEFKELKMGYEGGFAPDLKNTRKTLDLLKKAVKGNSLLALDCAASQFFKDDVYSFEGKKRSYKEMSEFYLDLIENYNLASLEDPFSEDDFIPWKELKQRIGDRVLLVGDDLLSTNTKRMEKAYNNNLCNAVILKLNQIGTVSECIAANRLAKEYNWKTIVSHRGGETEDSFISDLAVGIDADFIKSGAPLKKERAIKYERLLQIEKML